VGRLPSNTEVTRRDASVWLKKQGKGYQSRINALLGPQRAMNLVVVDTNIGFDGIARS